MTRKWNLLSNCTERSELKSDSIDGMFLETIVDSLAEGAMEAILGTYEEPSPVQKVINTVILGFHKSLP